MSDHIEDGAPMAADTVIRLLLADDHTMLREALRRAMEAPRDRRHGPKRMQSEVLSSSRRQTCL